MPAVIEIPSGHDPLPATGVSRDPDGVPRHDVLERCRGQLAREQTQWDDHLR